MYIPVNFVEYTVSLPHDSATQVCLGLLYEVPRPYSEASHSVGVLWTSDRHIAKTSTWQDKTLTWNIHAPPRDWNPQSQQARGRRPS